MKNNALRSVTWVITIVFGLLFLLWWIKQSSIETRYGNPATSIPWVLGGVLFYSIIPTIMLTIVYFFNKNERTKINQKKDKNTIVPDANEENDNFEKLHSLKLKINELLETNVLNKSEADEKIKLIDKKIENINIKIKLKENDSKLKEAYEKAKLNLDILKKEGIITVVEYVQKLERLKRSEEVKSSNEKASLLKHSSNNFDINSLDYDTEIFDIKNFPKLNEELLQIRPFALNNDPIAFRIILIQYLKNHSIESKYHKSNLNIVNAIVKQMPINELETLFRRYKTNVNFVKALELTVNNILSQPLI